MLIRFVIMSVISVLSSLQRYVDWICKAGRKLEMHPGKNNFTFLLFNTFRPLSALCAHYCMLWKLGFLPHLSV